MANIPEKFLKPYDPSGTEDRIYKMWEKSGYFNPDNLTPRTENTFSIVLPPPNVTGTLHMGHAATLAIEDLMVRYHRMRGDRTVWVPGTDHAAIATQSKVESILYKKEKKTRHDFGREAFLKHVEAFAKESHDTIINQVRKLGASVDWSREAFTLDETREQAVRTAFKNMYDDGLIYRGYRIVNWDPKGQTTVSDDEVIHEPAPGKLYTFKYSKDFPISIATTRPETKVGDTAVAVHPDDKRYQALIGKEYSISFCGVDLHIKIVGDEAVDPEYGTGAVGVTPAHSMTDWEIAGRHDLSLKQVINEYAKMINVSPELEGKKTKEAREIILEWLRKENLLEKEEDMEMSLSKAERSGGVIEPLPKLQWFIDVNKLFSMKSDGVKGIATGDKVSLKEVMREAVKNSQIEIFPESFTKVYFHWIDNLRDWCISRQIWYGHRIPVWYHGEEIYCGTEAPEGDGWEQDSDTLDTWFSSGLWTFSVLGWPSNTSGVRGKPGQKNDLANFHPTSVLETGYDILFFWVARMILMSGYHLGEIPFEKVYLHGIVRDQNGKKMSKSLGNIIDPLDMSEKFGADATRLSLIIGNPPGNDTKLSEDKIRAYRKFSNKIWNATRFVLSSLPDNFNPDHEPHLSAKDAEHLTKLEKLTKEITDDIEHFRFYLAGEKLYQYFWHTFADVVIEDQKSRLESEDAEEQLRAAWLLYSLLKNQLKLLHPFMPFITEEIWSEIPKQAGEENIPLIIAPWPTN
ncbi:MAG TPA: valine--tRNA ligase [Candidatus Paceibacterota bacterium]|nr:valine--tRNA ligase [Candidatus Paceibacterota bacterium]